MADPKVSNQAAGGFAAAKKAAAAADVSGKDFGERIGLAFQAAQNDFSSKMDEIQEMRVDKNAAGKLEDALERGDVADADKSGVQKLAEKLSGEPVWKKVARGSLGLAGAAIFGMPPKQEPITADERKLLRKYGLPVTPEGRAKIEQAAGHYEAKAIEAKRENRQPPPTEEDMRAAKQRYDEQMQGLSETLRLIHESTPSVSRPIRG